MPDGGIKAKIEAIVEECDARCIEVIDGDLKGNVGVAFGYDDVAITGEFMIPQIMVDVLLVGDAHYYVFPRQHIKIISIDELIEKGNLK